jgi:hypothetical protein
MVLRALRAVPDPETASPARTSAEFAAARRRWEGAAQERRALKARFDGAQAALALALNPPSMDDHPSPRLIEMANAYLGGRRSATVNALRREIVDLDDQLTRAATTYSLERASWHAAVEGEARRLAEELRPAHKAACRKIAAAVESLSAAVEQERKIRAKLAELGCSNALVDAGQEFGTLSEFNSLLSTWNRRLLAARVLD